MPDSVPLPDAALDDRWAIVGTSGAGKTYAARGMMERLLRADATVCWVDALGVAYGIRSSADGSGSGFPVVIFGGRHADVPITEHMGEAVGRIIADAGYSTIVVNLYSLRASQPSAMMVAESPIGPNNAAYLNEAIAYAEEHGGWLLAAWGNDGGWEGRDEWFCARALQAGVTLKCLGTTNSGKPKHPMARGKHRIPRDQKPVAWRNAAGVCP